MRMDRFSRMSEERTERRRGECSQRRGGKTKEERRRQVKDTSVTTCTYELQMPVNRCEHMHAQVAIGTVLQIKPAHLPTRFLM